MSQYNMLNVKLSNWRLNKLKPTIKNGTEVTLNLSSNSIGSSNDKTNFPHKLLLTNTQVSKICKAFANGWSANINISKTQLCKIVQSRRVLHDIAVFRNVLLSVAKKGTDIARNLGKHFLDKQIDRFNKEHIFGVIKSSENRGILLKETTRKITSQEGRF